MRVHLPPERGFTLLEVLLVSSLILILATTAVSLVSTWLPMARADAAMRQMTFNLTSARERAISQTRNIEVQIANNELRILRDEPGPGTTLLTTVPLEQDVRFMLFSNVPDTPDAFGRAASVDFGAAQQLRFTSDGSLIDQQGIPVNGTIFMGLPGDHHTARAVTVFGGTGRVRGYRWTGSRWEQ